MAAGQAAIPAARAEAAGGAKAPARTAVHAKVAAAKPTTPEAAEMAAAKTAATPEAAATVTAAATPATAMTSHRVGRPRKGHSGCQENCRHTKFMIDHGHLRARGDDTAAPTWASGAFPIFACSRRQAISPSPAESSPRFSGKAMADRQHMRCDKYQGHEKPGTRLPRAPSLLHVEASLCLLPLPLETGALNRIPVRSEHVGCAKSPCWTEAAGTAIKWRFCARGGPLVSARDRDTAR